MSTLKIIAKRVYPEDKIEEAIAVYAALQKETVKEEGCISYELFQDTRNKGTLIMIEEWRDMACIKAHTVSKHYKELGPKLGELGTAPMELNILTKVAL